jgi:LAO/AO transport system kinase
MVDFFVIKIAGAGDELQGIKRGIMEMADTIVINKADGDNIRKAQLAKSEFNRATSISSKKSQAGFLQLQLAVQLHKTDSSLKPSRNLSTHEKQ